MVYYCFTQIINNKRLKFIVIVIIYTYTPFYCGSMHILLLIYVDLPRLTVYFRIPGLVHHGVTQRGWHRAGFRTGLFWSAWESDEPPQSYNMQFCFLLGFDWGVGVMQFSWWFKQLIQWDLTNINVRKVVIMKIWVSEGWSRNTEYTFNLNHVHLYLLSLWTCLFWGTRILLQTHKSFTQTWQWKT